MALNEVAIKMYTKSFGNGEQRLVIVCDTDKEFREILEPMQCGFTGIEIKMNNTRTAIRFGQNF
jgi:hypothetical protein